MLKSVLSILFFAVIFVLTAQAQWVNQGGWPDPEKFGQNHSMAVDPDGKVWTSNFGTDSTVIIGSDTLLVRLIRVFNPDGSPASFSPIWKITVAGVTDTLRGGNNRGMRADHNGNIITVDGAQNMYRLNYKTGEGMNKVKLTLATSPTAPAVSEDGTIFVGPVVNANSKIEMYDPDFTYIGDAVNFVETGFSRSMEVSKDGNTIYFPIYTMDAIIIFNRADEFSAFDSIGVIFGPACESIAWNNATGDLWFSAGSYNDLPDPFTSYMPNAWYGYNVTTNTVTDSLHWIFTVPEAAAERPRAIDFSPDGNVAYIGCFGGAGYPLIQKVINTGVGVRQEFGVRVEDYSLSQNYPNPFNPSTEIKFTVSDASMVTVKVFDLLGKEVATLVNDYLTNGLYSVTFDATGLSSGTYIYQLQTSTGVLLSKKMLLVK
jgi:hypothetical protein